MADGEGESEVKPKDVYKLIFRYRHEKRTLNFYPPPEKFSEEHEYWDQLLEATRTALEQAFGEVSKYVVGIGQYVHGPVVPLSVVVTQPKRYTNCYLDLIIDDEAPFLVDIQTERDEATRNPQRDHLQEALEDIQLGSWYTVLTKEHKVDYESFLLLDKDDLKEMQVPIGVRKKNVTSNTKRKRRSARKKTKSSSKNKMGRLATSIEHS